MTRLLARIAALPTSATRSLVVILAVLLVLAGVGISQLRYEDGTRALFDSSRAEYAKYSAHIERYSQNDTVALLLISSERPLADQQIGTLRDLVLALGEIGHVEAVYSLFGVNTTNPAAGDIAELSSRDLAALETVRAAPGTATETHGAAQSLISGDRTQTVMLIALDNRLADAEPSAPTLDAIAAAANRIAGAAGLSIELTGMPAIRSQITERTYQDQRVVNSAGAILGFLISLIVFRSFWIAALNSIAPGIALVMALGMFGLAGFEINVMRNAVPILVLVLATADCIHLTYAFCRKASDGADIGETVRDALIELGPPCMLTSLTTIIAFAGLSLSQSSLIQSLSLSGMIALAMSLGVVLLVHPLVFVLAWRLAPVRRAMQRSRSGFLRAIDVGPITRSFLAWRRPVVLTAAALAIGLAFLFLPLKTDFRFYEYVGQDDALIETLESAESIAGPLHAIDIPLHFAEGQALSNETLDAASAIHLALEAGLPETPVVSTETLRRALEARDEWPSANNVVLALTPLPPSVSDSLIARDESGLLLRVMIGDLPSAEVRDIASRAEELARAVGQDALIVEDATGPSVVSARLSDIMIKQLAGGFLLVALACPLFIAFWHRRWDFGVAAILPNLLPILAVGAWLVWSGADIQFTSALALTLAFGIAVDDTVHVLNRLAIEQRSHPARDAIATIHAAMRHVAPALIATTAVLSVGILSTYFASVPTIWNWGQLCIAVFILALIADLLLLPTILALLPRKRATP